MVSSKAADEVGNREHHTQNGICVAFHLRFAAEKEWRVFISSQIRFFFELNRNEGVFRHYAIQQRCWQDNKKRGVPTKSKSSATGATGESTNSTVIKQSNNRRGTLLLARLLWSILVSSSNLVTLITQEYMMLQSVLRTL